MTKVIGIDLGTSNSCVAIMEAGEPRIITNEEGSRTTPSIVAFAKGESLVGNPAKRQAVTNAKNTIHSAKRFVGMRFDEVGSDVEKMPFEVRSSQDGMCEIVAGGKSHPPQSISAQVLSKMKSAAEKYLGEEVKEAVITVPAYFNDAQRQATRDAGKIAGLEVKRIINEPTAAAMAYGMDKSSDRKVLVYDLGGGTFDVSVLEIGDGVIEVMSTNGDTHLGGDDVDAVLIEWLISEFKKETGVDVGSDATVLQRLREAAERAKIELSSTQQTNINLPFLTADQTGPKHLVVDLTRSNFEKMIDKLVSKTMEPVRNALKDASLDKSDIDEILLVGGSTRIPLVRSTVEKFFEKAASSSVNPDEVVALGAAVQGGVFMGEVNDILLLDVTPLSLGLETMGGVMTRLIERNTTVPCSKSQVFTTAEDNQSAVDIKVLQGEREFARDNKMLGTFKLDGIPPSPRGVPQIEVTFNIDADGVVSVSAEDKATGKKQDITITGSGAMPPGEVDRLIAEARENEESDKKRKKEMENKNQLSSLIYQSEKLLSEHSEIISAEDQSALRGSIAEASTVLDNAEASEVEAQISSIGTLLQKVGKAMYESSNQNETPTQTEDTQEDEEIIDAEFQETG